MEKKVITCQLYLNHLMIVLASWSLVLFPWHVFSNTLTKSFLLRYVSLVVKHPVQKKRNKTKLSIKLSQYVLDASVQ